MTSHFRIYLFVFFTWLQILHFFTIAPAQDIKATIEFNANNPNTAIINGRFADQKFSSKNRNLSFVRSISGISDLGDRLSEVKLRDANGTNVQFITAVPGEYVADKTFINWNYKVDLNPLKQRSGVAHLSWINVDHGLLMLGDLLPIMETADRRTSAQITMIKPDNSRETISFDDVENAVVPYGSSFRKRTLQVGKTNVNLFVNGSWLFTDDEFGAFSKEIVSGYSEVFDNGPSEINIAIARMPNATGHGIWEADTRGRNVTLLSSDMPFKTQSVQRLHEQLRHEIFHLWIPNGVNLSGRYDWFYEGFALYSSLKLAVAKNRIRFDDFLDTLSRAKEIDRRQTNRVSLIEASRNRWNGSETYLYARGMITAFSTDVSLISSSKGKASVNDLVREIFQKHKYPSERIDGNAAIIAIFKQYPELVQIVEKFVNGSASVDWQNELSLAGLSENNGLTVASKLSGKQRDVLDALGYNNSQRLSRPK